MVAPSVLGLSYKITKDLNGIDREETWLMIPYRILKMFNFNGKTGFLILTGLFIIKKQTFTVFDL